MVLFKTRYLVLIFLLFVPILGSIFFIALFQDWRFENAFAHSILEVLGALAALVILASIIVGRTSLHLEKYEIAWIAAALAAMGSLDLFHASAPPGNEAAWFTTLASLAGGGLFACIWLRPINDKTSNSLPSLGVMLTLVLATIIILGADSLPLLIENNVYSSIAKILNIVGGVGFFSGVIYFIERQKKTGERDYFILATHCVLFGASCILFALSTPWEPLWWLWHVLRFAGYLSLVLFFTGARVKGLSDSLMRLGSIASAEVPENRKVGPPYFAAVAGAIAAILASIVIWAWYSGNTIIIQINPDFAPMQLNTAICFLLSGIGVLALVAKWRSLAFACGGIAGVFAAITLVQYILGINLGIDELLMESYILVKTSHPGRMAPNTAGCFILVSLAVVMLSQQSSSAFTRIATEIISLITLSLVALALAGYILGAEKGYAWGSLTGMSLNTSAGFILLSSGILTLCWRQKVVPIASVPLWFPALLCFGVLLFDMIYAEGLSAGVAYVPLVFCSLAFFHSKSAFVFAGLASALVLLGFFASSVIFVDAEYETINRLLSILAIWLTALFVHLLKATQFNLFEIQEAMNLGWRGAGDGMWDWNVLTNEVTFSDRFKELLGFKPDEFGNKFEGWADQMHGEDRDKSLAALYNHLYKGTPFEIEYRMKTKFNEWRWFLAKGQALWDDKGNPTRMAGSLSDVTYRKEAELQLRLLKLSVEHSKDLVMITNTDAQNPLIVFANKASENLTGYSPDELVGQSTKILEGPKTDVVRLEAKKEAIKNQQSFTGELLNYAKDGREFWIHVNMVPVKDEHGATTHFASIIRDITANKYVEMERDRLIEALERSNGELDDFAYVASHDLKAPLRVIHNASRWLEEDLSEHFGTETRESMELLRSRVLRMEKLLDDLLEFSSIGRKLDDSFSEEISGKDLLDDVRLLVSLPEKFNLNVSSAFNDITVNRMPLQHIFLNLIGNAIKHHDKVDGTIEVDVEAMGDMFCFSVKDDGPGIAPEFHEKIFKMFQTLRPRDRVEGSGIGLSMVRKNLEHFGGSIKIESDIGEGVVFRFFWPKIQHAVKLRRSDG